ncbi:MAG: hypothetical protein DRI44_00965 [Chlamydiae bacterium]|nr:MAG: hypothetical protein DRI44_00965 [Chlamydiota bacterium]
MQNIFNIKSIDKNDCTEFWLTSIENHGKGIKIINYAIDFLRLNNAQAFSIRLFGNKNELALANEELRSKKLRKITCPPLLLIDDSSELRIQLHAISKVKSYPLCFDNEFIGREFEDNNAKYLMMHILPDNANDTRYAQAENMFNKADKFLIAFNSSFSDAIRTWLYADNILEWYDQLNKVRNIFFEKHGIYQHLVPASTGIGLANLNGTAMATQVLAVIPKSGNISIQKAFSPLQKPAFDYKSSFSRGVKVQTPHDQKLYVSGTASIDKRGVTAFIGDTAAQLDMTMKVVNAILDNAKMQWSDTTNAMVYFKHCHDFHLFDNFCRKNKINIPHVKLQADICRDNLLFEIELDAIK